MKKEIKGVLQYLKKWDQEIGSFGYYFRKPKEQIAEFLGLFLRDPKKTAEIAPITFDIIRRQLIAHPELENLLGYDFANRAKATLEQSATTIYKLPVKIHPEIYDVVRTIFQHPFSNAGVQAWETINAIAKKSALSISFFHYLALTESAIAAGIAPFKFYKGIKLLNKNPEFTKRAIGAGLEIGAVPDVQIHRVNTFLEAIERKTKKVFVLNKITKGVRRGNELWDKALWDYYHTGLKLYAYETILAKELSKQ